MTLSALTLVINGVTLSLSMAFLVIILWYDSRLPLNQAFSYFLFAVLVWNLGAFLFNFASLTGAIPLLSDYAGIALEIGFVASSMTLYWVSTALVGLQSRYIRFVIFTGLVFIVGYRLLLIVITDELLYDGFQPIFLLSSLLFNTFSLFIIWRYRRKLKTQLMMIGVAVFVVGQGGAFVQPDVVAHSLSNVVSCFGVLTLSFGLIKQEIINPLSQRDTQVETIYQIGLAISSLLSLRTVLDAIATRAAGWLRADGVCICLTKKNETILTVVTAHNLPQQYIDLNIAFGQGVIGECVQSERTIFVENYARDWRKTDDLPLARDTFGSVICVPLRYGDQIIGALEVITSRKGHLFDANDVYALELLSSQAAIAISHSQLFEEQRELGRLRSEMVRIASHDLKNPLMGASAHVELMKEHEQVADVAELQQSLSVVEAQLARMERIIQGILDIERLSSPSAVDERCSPYEIVNNALSELSYFIDDHEVEIVADFADDLPDFRGNAKQFERAIINLIENAIKFTIKDNPVRVCVTVDDGNIRFSVSDGGVGIPEGQQDQVFDRFFRGEQPGVEHVTGSGLGLSIVKTVVENHGGRVYLESCPGDGSTFYIEVPTQ
ncbi:MAG: GAF domain-containing protein [Anaerolineaceae bacterium]|nr:MAG: GAF domain-containing protein [Anaerolineaceae bacterium]